MQVILIGLLLLYLGYRFGKKIVRLVLLLIGLYILWKSGVLIIILRFVTLFGLKLKEMLGL